MIRRFSLVKLRMEYQILLAIAAALLCGWLFPVQALDVAVMGTLYLNLLKFIIAPLLFFSIISSIVGIGSIEELGKLGTITLALYLTTTTVAIMISMGMMHLFAPAASIEVPNTTSFAVEPLSVASFLETLIPHNIISPFLENNMMQLVVMALLFGMAVLTIADSSGRARLHETMQTLTDVMLTFTSWIIALTPLGVFGLVAPLIAKSGFAPLVSLGGFVLVVLGSLALHALVALPLLAWVVARTNVYRYLWKLKQVLLFAFSTASSSATLPLSLTQSVEKGKLHKRVAQLVLPIGSTMNMDGTALYQAAVALFVAQGLGIELSFAAQATLVVTVVLASIGAAGIPGAGIVMLATVFATVGLPLEAIGVVMIVDRFLDMFRTAVNISGDLVVAKIVNTVYDKDLNA